MCCSFIILISHLRNIFKSLVAEQRTLNNGALWGVVVCLLLGAPQLALHLITSSPVIGRERFTLPTEASTYMHASYMYTCTHTYTYVHTYIARKPLVSMSLCCGCFILHS